MLKATSGSEAKVIVAHCPETVASAGRALILERGSVVYGYGIEGSLACGTRKGF